MNWEAVDVPQAITNALLIAIYVELIRRPRKGKNE